MAWLTSCNATIHGRRAEEETVSFGMNRNFKGLIEEHLANAK